MLGYFQKATGQPHSHLVLTISVTCKALINAFIFRWKFQIYETIK